MKERTTANRPSLRARISARVDRILFAINSLYDGWYEGY